MNLSYFSKSDTRKVLNAFPGQAWTISNWTDEVEVMGHRFTITGILEKAES